MKESWAMSEQELEGSVARLHLPFLRGRWVSQFWSPLASASTLLPLSSLALGPLQGFPALPEFSLGGLWPATASSGSHSSWPFSLRRHNLVLPFGVSIPDPSGFGRDVQDHWGLVTCNTPTSFRDWGWGKLAERARSLRMECEKGRSNSLTNVPVSP